MPIGQTNITFSAVYYEIFRTTTPANFTLEYLVLNSRLTDKSKPYDLGDFRGYDNTPTVTMDVLTASDDNYYYLNINFLRSFVCKFISTVYYTIDKNNGYANVQETVNITVDNTVVAVDFTADRRSVDYTISVAFQSVDNGYYTSRTQYFTVPAKITQPTETLAQQRGRQDAEYDNIYEPDYGVARPESWGYSYGTIQYDEYMNSYNANRLMQN